MPVACSVSLKLICIRPIASFSLGVGSFFPIQTTGAPQVYAETYIVNRLQEDVTSLHECHIFPKQTPGRIASSNEEGGSYFFPTQRLPQVLCTKHCLHIQVNFVVILIMTEDKTQLCLLTYFDMSYS